MQVGKLSALTGNTTRRQAAECPEVIRPFWSWSLVYSLVLQSLCEMCSCFELKEITEVIKIEELVN